MSTAEPVDFVPLGIVGEAGGARRPSLAPPAPERSQPRQASEGGSGAIEIALPNGVRIWVNALVSEKALSRVLRAMRSML